MGAEVVGIQSRSLIGVDPGHVKCLNATGGTCQRQKYSEDRTQMDLGVHEGLTSRSVTCWYTLPDKQANKQRHT